MFVLCVLGNDNALRQTLHLNVYRIKKAGGLTISVNSTNGRSAADPMMATLHNARIGSTTGVPDDDALSNTLDGQAINSLNPSDLLSDPVRSSPVHPTQQNRRRFIGQFNHLSTCGSPDSKRPASAVDLIVNQTVAINQTNQYIRFRRFKLSRVQPYLFIIFSSNSKGASEMLEFEWALDSGKRLAFAEMRCHLLGTDFLIFRFTPDHKAGELFFIANVLSSCTFLII